MAVWFIKGDMPTQFDKLKIEQIFVILHREIPSCTELFSRCSVYKIKLNQTNERSIYC